MAVTDNLDRYYLDQLLDDLEAVLAERQDKTLLNKVIDIRREIDNLYDEAFNIADTLDDIVCVIKDIKIL